MGGHLQTEFSMLNVIVTLGLGGAFEAMFMFVGVKISVGIAPPYITDCIFSISVLWKFAAPGVHNCKSVILMIINFGDKKITYRGISKLNLVCLMS